MKYLPMILILFVGCAEVKTRDVHVGMTVEELVIKRAATFSEKRGDLESYKFTSIHGKACTAQFKGGLLVARPYCVHTPESLARDQESQAMRSSMIEQQYESDVKLSQDLGNVFQNLAKSGHSTAPPAPIYQPAPQPISYVAHCKTKTDPFGGTKTDCE